MKKWLWFGVYSIFPLALGILLIRVPGECVFTVGQWSWHMPLWSFGLSVLLIVGLSHLFMGIGGLWHQLTQNISAFLGQKREQREWRALEAWCLDESVKALPLGAWSPALHELVLSFSAQFDRPLLEQDCAQFEQPLMQLLQVILLQKAGDWGKSYTVLQSLPSRYHGYPMVLRLKFEACRALSDWQTIWQLMSTLRRKNILSEIQFQENIQWCLKKMSLEMTRETLESFWNTWPTSWRLQPLTLKHYCEILCEQGAVGSAERVLGWAIQKQGVHDPMILHFWSDISALAPAARLECLADWGVSPKEADALNFWGQLCAQAKDWRSAAHYFLKSLDLQAQASVYVRLGQAYEQLGDQHSALLAYRHGLTALTKPSDNQSVVIYHNKVD